MSTSDAESAAAVFDAFRGRDAERLWKLMDPAVEFHSRAVGGEATSVYRGRAGIDRYFADLDDVFSGWHTDDERHLDAGEDRAVSLYRVIGEGRGSGLPVELAMGIVWTLRGGLILRGDVYGSPGEALAAAGLAETTNEEDGER